MQATSCAVCLIRQRYALLHRGKEGERPPKSLVGIPTDAWSLTQVMRPAASDIASFYSLYMYANTARKSTITIPVRYSRLTLLKPPHTARVANPKNAHLNHYKLVLSKSFTCINE